jgi:PHP family Zn ribbon phosphoesterase
MIAVETGDLDYYWECSECATQFQDSKKFSKATVCPECNRKITDWVVDDNEPI